MIAEDSKNRKNQDGITALERLDSSMRLMTESTESLVCGEVTWYLLKRGDGVADGGGWERGSIPIRGFWVYKVQGWLSPRMRFQRLGGRQLRHQLFCLPHQIA